MATVNSSGFRDVRASVARIAVPNPDAAQQKLGELTSAPWQWAVVADNCATFVEEIVQAGGAKRVGLHLRCPRAEVFK